MTRTTEDALCRAGLHPVLADGVEDFVVVVVRSTGLCVVVDVAIVKLHERIWALGVVGCNQCLSKILGSLGSSSLIISVCVRRTWLWSDGIGITIGEWRCSPKQCLAGVSQGSGTSDAHLVVSGIVLARSGLFPVEGKQLSSLGKVGSDAFAAFAVRETWLIQGLTTVEHLVDIGKTSQILNKLFVPPCTEEVELALNEVTLLLRGTGHQCEVLKTQVTFADAIEGMSPNTMAELVISGRVDITASEVGLRIAIPVLQVAQVHLVAEVRIAFARIHDLVFTPVESRTPEAALLIGDTVVDLLDKSLEVGEVLEGDFSRHLRAGLLVEVVGARAAHYGQSTHRRS